MECFRADFAQLPGCHLLLRTMGAKGQKSQSFGEKPSNHSYPGPDPEIEMRYERVDIKILYYTCKHINSVVKDWHKTVPSYSQSFTEFFHRLGGLAFARVPAMIYLERLLWLLELRRLDFKTRRLIGYFVTCILWSICVLDTVISALRPYIFVSTLEISHSPANTSQVGRP